MTVTDSGPGHPGRMPASRSSTASTAPTRRRGRHGSGSGLGLSICREIADAHGGRVWVDSEEGEGSAFSLALPRNGRS